MARLSRTVRIRCWRAPSRLRLLVLGAVIAATLAASAWAAPAKRPFGQVGNYRPVTAMALRDGHALADNKVGAVIGSFYGSQTNPTPPYYPEIVRGVGFKWVRLSFAGNDALEWQNVTRVPGEYIVDAGADEAITQYARDGTTIILDLDIGDDPGLPQLDTPQQEESYLGYVGFMVKHFKGRVAWFEILNEPERMPVERYISLARRAIAIARAEDPEVKVVVGTVSCHWEAGYPGYGSAMRSVFDTAYFETLLQSDVVREADAISWHPMYGTRADDPYYRQYPKLVARWRGLAKASGFKGQLISEEMIWPNTVNPRGGPSPLVSEPIAIKYLLRTIVLHRGLDVAALIAPPGPEPLMPMNQALLPLNNVLAGTTPAPMKMTVRTKARPWRRATFVKPNGTRLIALWTDGLPRDSNRRVRAALSLPGRPGRKAALLDPLQRREQSLITKNTGHTLVIRDLLVGDYPIFVRIR